MKKLNVRTLDGFKAVAVYREFEMYGFQFFIHRVVDSKRGYQVSEFSTGYGVPAFSGTTILEAEERAKEYLKKHGKKETTQVVNLVRRTLGNLTNKEKKHA